MRARSSQRGFTLVELMISLVLFSFVIAGVLAVAVSMTQGYREQRAAVGAESAVRLPLDFLTDALRQASPAVSTALIQDAATCSTSALKVTNNTGVNVAGNSGWDQLDMIFASGAVTTTTRTAYGAGTTSLDVDDATGLAIGDSIVISNLSQGHLVQITNIATNTLTLAAQCGTIALPSGGYAAGSIVVRAVHGIFFLSTIDGIPTLMMNATGDPTTNATKGEPLAEGIEDMQIALGYDTDNNSTVDEVGVAAGDDEWQGNVAGDAALSGTLHAVRITLVARTTSTLIGIATPFFRPAAEDNAASATFDTYRRRVMRSMIELRNMGGSP